MSRFFTPWVSSYTQISFSATAVARFLPEKRPSPSPPRGGLPGLTRGPEEEKNGERGEREINKGRKEKKEEKNY